MSEYKDYRVKRTYLGKVHYILKATPEKNYNISFTWTVFEGDAGYFSELEAIMLCRLFDEYKAKGDFVYEEV